MKYFLPFIIFLTCSFSTCLAQSGGPRVVTDTAVAVPCGANCVTLRASAFGGYLTDSYSVDSIAYNPFPFDTGVHVNLSGTSDGWAIPIINLPFVFCFFGNAYNQIDVGSNGVLSFDLSQAGVFNTWNINGPIPANSAADLQLAILSPWQSFDAINRGNIRYFSGGLFPNRYFVVSWDSMPLFGDANSSTTTLCGGDSFFQTQQIVLHEITNVIDINIKEKGVCPGWNGGLAVEGIQSGGLAYTVPGRNATQWTAANDAWRFTPNGAPNYSTAWYQDTTLIGIGDTIAVCPPTDTSYIVQATYNLCGGGMVTVSDTVHVTLNGPIPQPICIVTADSSNTFNTVVWDKVNKYATDSFYIYRTVTPGTIYTQIAALNRDSLSSYDDTSAHPDLMSYRYKMNLLDTCGNYSPLSDYHQTIYLQYLGTDSFQWTPYVIENAANPVTAYDFYRDTSGIGNWQLVNSYSNSATIATDLNFASFTNPRYRVVATLNYSCNPTRSLSEVSSNIITIIETGVYDLLPLSNVKLLYNPVHEQADIVNINQSCLLQLTDNLGRVLQVISSTSNKVNINLGSYVAGLYFVGVTSGGYKTTLKVVKY